MVKQIVRDQFFLQQKSEPATEADKQVVEDLLDTLRANQDRCVGMAANMIGVKKRIIVVAMEPFIFPMINQEREFFHFLNHATASFPTSSALRFSCSDFRIFCDDLERFSSSSMNRLILRTASWKPGI